MGERRPYGLIVVGGGVAGLTAALEAAAETDVLLLAKAPVAASNSWNAQGGVAAAIGEGDTPALHAADTFRAGRGLCRESAVTVLTEEAPARIAELVARGVEFDDDLGREGGHSMRRIVHAGGAETGKAISEVLADHVWNHPRIDVADEVKVLSLWVENGRCVGIVTDHGTFTAPATLLSTGGYAALWSRTTNPKGALGEGLVLAYDAGAALADLEFVQFHPTALLDDGFLLSEALRGEGAVLVDGHGDRFTDELAPRDVVARAIAERGHAGLDLRAIERGRFPGAHGDARAGRIRPGRRADPGLAGRALHRRRDRHRSRRGDRRSRPLCGRRVRSDRRPRRESTCVELAARMPRLRSPGRARGARRRARRGLRRRRPSRCRSLLRAPSSSESSGRTQA